MVLQGMAWEPEREGARGTVVAINKMAKIYRISLDDGRLVQARLRNLALLPPEAEAGGGEEAVDDALSVESARNSRVTPLDVLVDSSSSGTTGLNIGDSASKSLLAFIECFEPLAAQSDEAIKLRAQGFALADPNGHGQCSLVECEAFILQALQKKIGNRGRDVFELFRPGYLQAFNDSKSTKKVEGASKAPSSSSPEDQVVSKTSFRRFCLHLCVNATMVRSAVLLYSCARCLLLR